MLDSENWTWGDGNYVIIHGIYFKEDGSVAPGAKGYNKIDPTMWREGTTNRTVAEKNAAHLAEYRAEAMERWKHDRKVINQRIKDQARGIEYHSKWDPSDLYGDGTYHIDLNIPNDFEGFCADAKYVEPEIEIT